MYTRRSFLRSVSLYSAGALAAPALASFIKAGQPTIGLQLYTVRDAMQADPAGTLARVAQIGYNSLEGATYTGTEKFYGMDPKTFKDVLKKNGLVMRSSHYRLGEDKGGAGEMKGTMLDDWGRAVDDAAALGVQYMVCAWLSPAERKGLDHYKWLAGELNKAGEKCKKSGIQFCYHNHDFEFEKQGGQYPYDVVLDNTDKNLVKMEIDLYWVTKAGQDPIALFAKNPGRFPLWHLKDMDATPEHSFTEVGNGTIDFKKIFAHASHAGMKYFFVEQDKCPGSPFDSITKSIAYIKKNLV
ncbi:MAG: sugar phosphate isomerase/epimerase [Chitinophagaceae bacterium]|nr:sugar phosphate isomerase/epimerase [Chitinophagaceae bacterium]